MHRQGLIIGANSKMRCSRHFNFVLTILQIEGRVGTRPLVIFFPFRYVTHSSVISCISTGKYSLLFFHQRNFSDVTPADYTGLCSVPFMRPFFVIIVNRMRFRPDARMSAHTGHPSNFNISEAHIRLPELFVSQH